MIATWLRIGCASSTSPSKCTRASASLGAGSEFRSAEELDFVLRALGSGHAIYETDRAVVTHSGQRPLAHKPALPYDYCFGIGATYMKHLKCGRLRVLQALVPLGCRWLFGAPVVSFGTPPDRSVRLEGFLQGARAGARTKVNRRALLYRTPSAAPSVEACFLGSLASDRCGETNPRPTSTIVSPRPDPAYSNPARSIGWTSPSRPLISGVLAPKSAAAPSA